MSNEELDAATQELTQALRSRVRVVQRPFNLYHWGLRAGLGERAKNPLRATDEPAAHAILMLARGYLQQPLNPEIHERPQVGAFYGATDPVFTRAGGGARGANDWFLARIELPQGARVLDLTAMRGESALAGTTGIAFRAQRSLVLGRAGCTGLDFRIDRESDPRCINTIRRIVGNLQVDAVQYESGQFPFRRCLLPSRGAFILTSDRLLRLGNVRLFLHDTNDAADERALVQATFLRGTLFLERALVPLLRKSYEDYKKSPKTLASWRPFLARFHGVAEFTREEDRLERLSYVDYQRLVHRVITQVRKLPRSERFWAEDDLPGIPAHGLTRWMKSHLFQCGDFYTPGKDASAE